MKSRRVWAIVLVLTLVVALAGQAVAQSDKERFGWAVIDKATVNNSLAVNGTTTLTGAVTLAGGLDLDGSALTIDADGDTILDESADDVVGLTMGAATGTFSVLTGNAKVGNGAPTVAQDGEDLYVNSVLEVDGISYLDGGTIFVTADLNGTALTIDADADTILDESADDVVGLTMGAATGTFSVLTGNAKVGDGAPTVAQDGEDLYVNDVLEVDGETQLDGALDANGAADFAAAVTAAADVTISAEATGGNAGAKNELIGLPRIRLAGVGVKDGAAEIEVDTTPDGEWTGTPGVVTDTTSTANYKIGANSLKLAFGAATVAGEGATNATPGGDWTGFKSIGFWVFADKAFTAAQLVIYLTDATDPATFNTCAYATPNIWQYCEVDISSLAGTAGDAVTDIDVRMAAGLPVPINIYIDEMVAWSAADEVSLVVELQQDGDLGFINALTGGALTAGVDYAIAYRTGVDAIVVIADLDPDGGFGLVAY